jgi:ribosome-binding factor A
MQKKTSHRRARHQASGPSQRQRRVGEQLRHTISETMRRGHFHDETLLESAHHITVSEVRPSPDLKAATAFIMTLGGVDMDLILPALNEAAPYFQKEINRQLNLKFTPRIKFVKDESFDEARRIDDILKGLSPALESDSE